MWSDSNPFLNGPFEPLSAEKSDATPAVIGVIPPDLRGALYRTGNASVFKPLNPDRAHWFDADGDAVGFEARGHGHVGAKQEAPATVLNSLMQVTRVAGKIGIPGLYVTEDPGAVDSAAKIGALSIRFGLGWAKSHSFHTGQTPVMKYNRALMQAIMWDRINIADIVGVQVISLEDAPRGYEEFDAGAPKKFVIDPHKSFIGS